MTPTILDTIADFAKGRVAADQKVLPLNELRRKAEAVASSTAFPFEKALSRPGMNFICEVKKASPSKGLISEQFPYQEIAKEYEAAGAACISVLTEPKWFLGADEYLSDIRAAVSIPLLRKDFTVDEYQIYQARVLGADAVLLICALLSESLIREYLQLCDALGLSALVEAHDENEVAAAHRAGARIIGVNNRNLKDFTVDVRNCLRLRNLVPDGTLFIAESGIQTAEDVAMLREGGVSGVLIGETLMRAPDKKKMLCELRGDRI
jgi:indole-3-glycerol phosphate synthase